MARLIKPPAVAPGATIAIVAPASSAKPDRIERGLAALQSLGFTPKPGPNALLRGPLYFAGTAAERLADFHAAFSDPSPAPSWPSAAATVQIIFSKVSTSQPSPPIPSHFSRTATSPASSSICSTSLAFLPSTAPCSPPIFIFQTAYIWKASAPRSPASPTRSAPPKASASSSPPRKKAFAGTLYGGCLSILVSLLGTPWEPATENKLLFLEDIGVKPYQIDRMLWQLRAAGKLAGVCGIIFGEMVDCVSAGAAPDLLDRAILSALDGLDIPIAIGLRSGHVSRSNVTLTFGVAVELSLADEPTLKILEPAVTR